VGPFQNCVRQPRHHYAYTVQIWAHSGLNIEQFWPFEEISIFSNSGHLEWRAGLSDTILKGTHLGTDEILIVHCCFSVSQNELKF
jgi:hypothetical protein